MQIAVLPASARAGEATIRTLLSSPSSHKIKAFYRNPSKAPQEFQSDPRFEAVQGDAVSGDNLDLSGSEAVLYVAPLILNGEDSDVLAAKAAANIKRETERVGTVKRLVLQSALGSQYDGIGVLRINKITDEALKNAAPRTFIVRPCTYYDNWVAALKSVQEGATSFDSYVSPADWKIPMVDMVDIGEYLAKLLLDDANTISTDAVDLFGPRLYSSNDVRDAIAQVTGKQVEVRPVPVEELTEWWGKQVPERYVKDFTEFVTCQLEGGVISVQRYGYDEHTVRGKRELVDFLRASL